MANPIEVLKVVRRLAGKDGAVIVTVEHGSGCVLERCVREVGFRCAEVLPIQSGMYDFYHLRTADDLDFVQFEWNKAKVLLMGAILCTGKRTVTSALMVMGYSDRAEFSTYHQVLNRASWSPRAVSQVLLRLLLRYLDRGEGPLVFGLNETIKRRWGSKINARGIYRDSVRSSKSHFVKASGLRWVCLMWLTEKSWAERVWALPFLTVLAPVASPDV